MSWNRWLSCLLLGAALGTAGSECLAACINTIQSESVSPNGRLKAVLFVRDCGSGSRNVHLSVLPAPAALPPGRGNTFIGEGDLHQADEKDRLRVTVTWLSDTELSVLHGVIRRLRYVGNVHGVKVYYGHLVDVPLRQPSE